MDSSLVKPAGKLNGMVSSLVKPAGKVNGMVSSLVKPAGKVNGMVSVLLKPAGTVNGISHGFCIQNGFRTPEPPCRYSRGHSFCSPETSRYSKRHGFCSPEASRYSKRHGVITPETSRYSKWYKSWFLYTGVSVLWNHHAGTVKCMVSSLVKPAGKVNGMVSVLLKPAGTVSGISHGFCIENGSLTPESTCRYSKGHGFCTPETNWYITIQQE
jgi:hypothetical protein